MAAAIVAARGQTQIDLRTQGRNVDFAAAASTRPSKTGTSLPAACSIGETFLKTDAAAGKNFFVCTAQGVWTVQGVEIPNPTGKTDQILSNDGAGYFWRALGGDIGGPAGAVVVGGLSGRKLSGLAPLDGQFLKWNGTLQQWEATTLAGALSVFGRTGAIAAQTGDYSFPQISGTVAGSQLPAAAGDLSGALPGPTVVKIQGRPIAATTPLTGQVLGWDGAQWMPQSAVAGVTSLFGRTGAVIAQSGDYTFGQIAGTVASAQLPAAGGDLSGALTSVTVAKLQGRTVSSAIPTTGQFLGWNGTLWIPQTVSAGVTSTFGRTGAITAQSGDYVFAQISGTVASAQLPASGGDLSGMLTAATVNRIQNRLVSSLPPSTGHVLTWDGTQWGPSAAGGVTTMFGRTGAVAAQAGDYSFPQISGTVAGGQLPTAGGDLSGALSAATVARIQNRAVAVTSPTTGQVLGWDGTQWTPQTVAGGVTSTFGRTGAITAQTGDYSFGQISGSVAGAQLPAAGGDLNGTLSGARVTGLQNRPVASSVPATGAVLSWDGTQWTPQTFTAGGVTSMLGRVGAVTAQSGDYNFAQISGPVAAAQLPAAAGDLSGALGTPTVAGLQNRPVASSVPGVGQVLTWNGSQWAPQATTGGVTSLFGRTGTVTAQSGDYSFGQTSGSVAVGQLPGAGGDLSGTLASATVGRLQSRPMASVAPGTGQVLTWDGAQWSPQTPSAGGGTGGLDRTVSNTYTAGAKQTFVPSLATGGINVTPGTLPTNAAAGDVAIDSGDGNKLKVYDGAQWNTLIALSNYTTTFTAVTLVTVNGTTHRLGTANLIVDCYDSLTPSSRVEPDRVIIDPLVYNVSIYFAGAQSGHCVITGSSGASVGGGSGAGMTSQLGDLGLVQTSPTVLTAGLNCSNATPCNVRLGNTVLSVTNSSTITVSAGTGTVYLYVDASGALTAGHNLTLSCAGVCSAVPGITSFPAGSIPLYTWSGTGGTWDASGGTDRRAFLSTRNVSSGAGIVTLDTGTQSIVAVDSATVPTYLASTGVIDFVSIAPSACAEMTFPLAGAAAGDSVAPGWPAAMEAGLIGTMRISASGVVAVRVCNLSGTTVDPVAATFRATIVRSF
ncbi:MAG: hypothetical protein JWP63_2439 [Candidatus Solibacter sp.]|nr:hypothetical protein [Candidatus Solibacter sp.]